MTGMAMESDTEIKAAILDAFAKDAGCKEYIGVITGDETEEYYVEYSLTDGRIIGADFLFTADEIRALGALDGIEGECVWLDHMTGWDVVGHDNGLPPRDLGLASELGYDLEGE